MHAIFFSLLLVTVDVSPETPAPSILEFMASFSETILYVQVDTEGGEPVIEYWKSSGKDLAQEEALSYLRTRKLLDEIEPGFATIFFLRTLSEKEKQQAIHFMTRIESEEEIKKFNRRNYHYALVRLLHVVGESVDPRQIETGQLPDGNASGDRIPVNQIRTQIEAFAAAGTEREPSPGGGEATPRSSPAIPAD